MKNGKSIVVWDHNVEIRILKVVEIRILKVQEV